MKGHQVADLQHLMAILLQTHLGLHTWMVLFIAQFIHGWGGYIPTLDFGERGAVEKFSSLDGTLFRKNRNKKTGCEEKCKQQKEIRKQYKKGLTQRDTHTRKQRPIPQEKPCLHRAFTRLP